MYENKISNSYILTLISVFFVSLIFNLFIRNETDFDYLVMDINELSNLILQKKRDVILYIVFHRIKQLFILIILIKAFGINKIYNGILVSYGGIIGLMVSVQVYYLGVEGVIILLAYVLPHYIIYYLGLRFGVDVKLFKGGLEDNIKRFVTFCLIFVLGMLLECTFLTFFLKKIYQYMVIKI